MGGNHFKRNRRGSISTSERSPKGISVNLWNTSSLLNKLETGQGILSSCWHDSRSREQIKIEPQGLLSPWFVVILGGTLWYPAPTSGPRTGHHDSGCGGNAPVPTHHCHYYYYIKKHLQRLLKPQTRTSRPTDWAPDGSLV